MTEAHANGAGPRLEVPQTAGDLEELLDHVGDQVSMWDDRLRVVWGNTAARLWTGGAQARGIELADIVGADFAALTVPFFREADTGATVRYPRVLAAPDGSPRTFSVVTRAVRSSSRTLGYVVVGTDMSALAAAVMASGSDTTEVAAERARVGAVLDERVWPLLRRAEALTAGNDLTAVAAALDETIAVLREVIRDVRGGIAAAGAPPPPRVPQRQRPPDEPQSLAGADAWLSGNRWTALEALAYVDELPPLTAWDVELRNVFANRAALRRLGASSRREVAGRDYAGLVGPELAGRVLPHLREALEGRPVRTEAAFRDASGVVRTAQLVHEPVFRSGRVMGVVSHSIDLDPQLSAIAGLAVNSAADMRERIAEDLHDSAIQHLYAAGLALGGADSELARARAQESVWLAADALVAAVDPDAPTGADDAAVALRELAEQAEAALDIRPRLELIGDTRRIDPAAVREMVAVVTEAVSNAARHGHASSVYITVAVGAGQLWLRVADDGVGIGVPVRSSGLANMAARADRRGGSFVFGPREPHGTVVDWRVPL